MTTAAVAETSAPTPVMPGATAIAVVPLSALYPSPTNPRKHFDGIDELAASLTAKDAETARQQTAVAEAIAQTWEAAAEQLTAYAERIGERYRSDRAADKLIATVTIAETFLERAARARLEAPQAPRDDAEAWRAAARALFPAAWTAEVDAVVARGTCGAPSPDQMGPPTRRCAKPAGHAEAVHACADAGWQAEAPQETP